MPYPNFVVLHKLNDIINVMNRYIHPWKGDEIIAPGAARCINKITNKALKGHKNMWQSLVQNYLHIVFSTKNRVPFITNEVEDDLHAYLGGICNNLDCYPIKIGGYTDHVHILCLLSKKIALVKLLEEVILFQHWNYTNIIL